MDQVILSRGIAGAVVLAVCVLAATTFGWKAANGAKDSLQNSTSAVFGQLPDHKAKK